MSKHRRGEQWYDVPYVQSYSFNAFGNFTVQDNKQWGLYDFDFTHDYENNRLQTGWSIEHDADGRQTSVDGMSSDILTTTYDAAGRPTFFHRTDPSGETEITRHYNGDGREEKREKRVYAEVEPDEWEWTNEPTEYYIRSTVLGGAVVSNTSPTGAKYRTFVRAAGAEIAWQNKSGSNEEVIFQNWDAAGSSFLSVDSSGSTFTNFGSEGAPAELGPLGGNVGTENPVQQVPGDNCVGCGALGWEEPMRVDGQTLKTNLEGMDVPHSMAFALRSSGMAAECPNFSCSVEVRYNGQTAIAYWTAYGDGYVGYVPTNAAYVGGGFLRPKGSGGPPRLHAPGPNEPRDTDIAKLNGVGGE